MVATSVMTVLPTALTTAKPIGGLSSANREYPQCGSSTVQTGDSCYRANRSNGHTTTTKPCVT
jgi:hypothetical protein